MNQHISELERQKLAYAKAIRLKLMGKPEKKPAPVSLPEPIVAKETKTEPPPIAPIHEWPVSMFSASDKPLFATDYIKRRCAENGLSYAEIMGRSRSLEASRPRQMLMVEVHELYNKSLPEIGRLFGRDHTTVLHALRNVEKYRLPNGAFDIRSKWKKMLDDVEMISGIRSMFFEEQKFDNICAKFGISRGVLTSIINHFRWARMPISPERKAVGRVYPLEEMQQDFFDGMPVTKIAKKYHVCPGKIARWRDDLQWVRKAPVVIPPRDNQMVERNRKMRILFESGMSPTTIGTRFHIKAAQVQNLARNHGWKRREDI